MKGLDIITSKTLYLVALTASGIMTNNKVIIKRYYGGAMTL